MSTPTPPQGHEALEGRLRALEAELERAERGAGEWDRADLREEIVRLFRDAEAAIARLGALRDRVRPLAERYRALYPRAPEPRPAAAGPRVAELGASTYLDRGWSALAEGKHALAEAELLRARELDPAGAEASALLAWAQALQGRADDAAATVDALLARAPQHALGWAVAGLVRLRQGDPVRAVECLSRALRLPGERKAALYANLFLGMVYIERGMHRDARLFLQRAIEAGPNLVEAYWELGRSHYLEGEHQAALETWRRGARQNPFSLWGERCARAAARLEAGGAVSLD